MNEFTDELCALEEAQWLADNTGWAHVVAVSGDAMVVVKTWEAAKAGLTVLETVQPELRRRGGSKTETLGEMILANQRSIVNRFIAGAPL